MHDFCDTCPGCRPTMFNADTGEVYPDTDPRMIAINRVWNHETTYAQRKAFILFTVHNNREANVMALFAVVRAKMERAVST